MLPADAAELPQPEAIGIGLGFGGRRGLAPATHKVQVSREILRARPMPEPSGPAV